MSQEYRLYGVDGSTIRVAFNSDCRFFEMRGGEVRGMNAGIVDFRKSNFSGVTFESCTFSACDLRGATFRNCSFVNTSFVGCDFLNSRFLNAVFSGCRFSFSGPPLKDRILGNLLLRIEDGIAVRVEEVEKEQNKDAAWSRSGVSVGAKERESYRSVYEDDWSNTLNHLDKIRTAKSR